ncbi:hypothetical protein G4Y79_15305 [Phototrophicus methaneseepsis]|uniref:Uncharacterized protein n=1 Tax=Phototrophicus methaneseepsis TaxID=2710758 RepID=A0A7S8E660_9CHLR|nr:hypothetical protein [Phototrophicus methaneseepsis]QPC81070.1 hypothetical protein G4Y79_15305 [Phototrophicus methaneseepsis]
MVQLQALAPELLYVEFDGVEISAVGLESFDAGIDEETSDTTHIKSFLSTPDGAKLRDTVAPTARIKVDGSATGQAILAKLKQGVTANLVWGYEGNGAGKPKYGIVGRCSANRPIAVGDIQMIDVKWANEGDDWLHNYDRDGTTF